MANAATHTMASMHDAATGSTPGASAFHTILVGGGIAGILDISDAVILTLIRGGRPMRMLQGIAYGMLGPRSFEGGAATAALGLAVHFFIALSAATVYFAASRKLPVLLTRPIVCGIAFGLCVWAFMQFVVIPLSLIPPSPWPRWPFLMNQWLIHAFGVGVPIAWAAARSARSR